MWLIIIIIMNSYLSFSFMKINDVEKVKNMLQFLTCKSSMHFFIFEKYVSTLLSHLINVMLNKFLHNKNSALNSMTWYKLLKIIHITWTLITCYVWIRDSGFKYNQICDKILTILFSLTNFLFSIVLRHFLKHK